MGRAHFKDARLRGGKEAGFILVFKRGAGLRSDRITQMVQRFGLSFTIAHQIKLKAMREPTSIVFVEYGAEWKMGGSHIIAP